MRSLDFTRCQHHGIVSFSLSLSSPPLLSLSSLTVLHRVWEHPHTNNTIWLARATPRAWLAEGEIIRVTAAPCSLGRVSYVLVSEIDSAKCITANVSLTLHKSVVRKSSSTLSAEQLRFLCR